ncbi:MAG: relaxase/mobilization nuclease domain-containing protein [Muribaculum sp.]|nr:relaxase/mobilization nuclease domain-containing protein [Muribaculum sp.]
MKNFGELDILGYSSPVELSKYLIDYSAQNSRIKQPQMHVAFSCKGHEYTPAELMEIAHQWLDKMGYGDPDQPLLIYEHHDTDNTHIHVITSRVNPKGKKIKDSHEKRRSQTVLDKIMNTNLKNDAEQNVMSALDFDFRNVTQFKSIMEAMNYECFEKNDKLYIKKGGMIQTTISTQTVKDKIDRNNLRRMYEPGELAQLKAIMRKYKRNSTSRLDLERDLKSKFGISLVFFGEKDSPYGYAAVDMKKKKVYQGGHIMSVQDLLNFKSPEEHLKDIEELIHNELEQSEFVTTHQLNLKLRKFGAYVKKGTVCFGKQKHALTKMQSAILSRNDKVAWRNGFQPQSESERNLVCKLTGFDYPDLISIKTRPNYFTKDYNEVKGILDIKETDKKIESLETAGFWFVRFEEKDYLYRAESQTIIDLERSGFGLYQYADLSRHYTRSDNQSFGRKMSGGNEEPKTTQKRNPKLNAGAFSRSDNREWEVGKHESDRDDMDRNSGMSY